MGHLESIELPNWFSTFTYFTMERSTIFFMGKLTISMASFSSYVQLAKGSKGYSEDVNTTL